MLVWMIYFLSPFFILWMKRDRESDSIPESVLLVFNDLASFCNSDASLGDIPYIAWRINIHSGWRDIVEHQGLVRPYLTRNCILFSSIAWAVKSETLERLRNLALSHCSNHRAWGKISIYLKVLFRFIILDCCWQFRYTAHTRRVS